MSELSKENFDINSLEQFINIYNNVLNKNAPQKEEIIRGSHSPFTNEEMSRTIMTGSRLQNKYLKNESANNKQNYSKQGKL